LKSVAIISPDSVPLPILAEAPETIIQDEKEVSLRDKCSRATSLGMRAWRIAEQLSKHFKVTVFIPNINFPDKSYIDTSKLFCDIDIYDYEICKECLEPRLQKKLIEFNVVIIQNNSGTAFWNCAFMPERIKVILDGWTILPVELPLSLLGYEESYKKKIWEDITSKYHALVKRANCILYNLDSHRYYYEGVLLTVKNGGWNSIKRSNLIRLTFGVDKNEKIKKNTGTDKLKLLWYGPAYPWYNPELLIQAVSEIDTIELDFYAVKHPRFSGSYYRLFESIFDSVNSPNIRVNLDYQDNHWKLYPNYDAGIILSKGDLESLFSLRIRAIDMMSYGLPILSNDKYPFEKEDDIKDIVYPISLDNLKQNLKQYAHNRHKIGISDESFSKIQDIYSWESTTKELINYIGNI